MMKGKKRIIAENIRRFRDEASLTQKELGLLLGYGEETAQSRITEYERGKRTPNSMTLDKLAEILKKPANAFFTEGGRLPEHGAKETTHMRKPSATSTEVLDEEEQGFIALRREAAKYGKDVVERIESYGRFMIDEAKKKKAARSSGTSASAHTGMVRHRGRKAGN